MTEKLLANGVPKEQVGHRHENGAEEDGLSGEEESHRPELSSPLADEATVRPLEETTGEPARLEDVPGQPATSEDDQCKGEHANGFLVGGANALAQVVHVRVLTALEQVQVRLTVRGGGDDQRHDEENAHEGEQENEVEGGGQPDVGRRSEGEKVQPADGEWGGVVAGRRVGDLHGNGVAEGENEQGKEQTGAPDAEGDDLHGGGVGDAGVTTYRLPLVQRQNGDWHSRSKPVQTY